MGSGQLGKRWALPPGKESSTCTGTWNSIRDPPADSNPTSARKTRVNLEETETSNLPPRRNRDLSYCSCPSSIPSSCLYPTYLSGPHCQGRNAAEVWPTDAVSWSECWLREAGVEGSDERFLLWDDWGFPVAKSPGATRVPFVTFLSLCDSD